MKLIDKLKNALFEEEYVEVEEKPKKEKIKKEKVKLPKEEKREIRETREARNIVKEPPIAKKIAPEEREEEEEDIVVSENSFKFPMIDDDDFTPEESKIEEEVPEFISETKYEPAPAWGMQGEKKPKKEYIEYETKDLSYTSNDLGYANYEREEKVTKFEPSPIISPIYGVLDKNYRKEDVRDKKERKEVRLTSPYSRDKISVDDVRNKAFATLEDDIEDNPLLEQVAPIEKAKEEKKMVDLTSKKKPRVSNVTMGEAEEYFEDLGLEYNKDYVDSDTSLEKEEVEEPVEEQPIVEDKADTIDEVAEDSIVEEKDEKEEKAIETEEDDNLFDLIDSMYEE